MKLDKNIQQQLAELIADPQKASPQHSAMLSDLLQMYPYYQPLHLLLAKADLQRAKDTNQLAQASLYTNGSLLHHFLFRKENKAANFLIVNGCNGVREENEQEILDQQEIYEEIAEVDHTNYRPFKNSEHPAETINTEETAERKNSLEDDFVFESIASSDFFAFEQNFSTEVIEQQEKEPEQVIPVIEEHESAAAAEVENSQISNYHDENLPYTFLWWLAKTRKEHQSIFQPYAVPKTNNSQELQQQYVEHIFHIQSHLTGNETLLENEEQHRPATKDAEIIESFIKNDPQIMPPKAEQIDNENKAKKSAEDQNDLVSETLANIYIEQMLYDKAIDTYEKLSLKFPEKRRYFADLIQSIEKKI
ncbi:hypothetical protein TH53_02925 [Pedobacter lusitanus]|uniref:Tetratricopeptide repeat protein n=1 Tax=Pedobacter lusitanus TaxID=1503925 RepID=A0A0D0GMW4_9SPHI|nr:hypothetical protein [Pedobacter lusitanus]KIO78542.1 hypothetical protein TH53_02925 [Pedobacter lusitanus]